MGGHSGGGGRGGRGGGGGLGGGAASPGEIPSLSELKASGATEIPGVGPITFKPAWRGSIELEKRVVDSMARDVETVTKRISDLKARQKSAKADGLSDIQQRNIRTAIRFEERGLRDLQGNLKTAKQMLKEQIQAEKG